MMKHGKKVILNIILLIVGVTGVFLYFNRPFKHRLAAFVTDLGPRSFEQRENIQRAGNYLSGTILQSGEILSLNHSVGPYTKDRGFLPERSFIEKELVLTEGGGVCQLASTLYNAARRAGLQILERIPHSHAVQSVPPGMDATVSYGVADLKLKNPYPFPVKIVSRILQDQLRIEIWGKELPDGKAKL